ncbi:Aste57867_13829 [Aphanomyces stellatus]|uniref:Aste57867_13829 protein n=1 Tax=Aphanomyces stellatus TaxID=120398 RepID=A0A485KZ35_9STRA|nr:hypothetical protein As57867_013779 [Aphanomyces stellatus]VFT90661.1 Aste57867_13829 [Aphanomyces stellatus]
MYQTVPTTEKAPAAAAYAARPYPSLTPQQQQQYLQQHQQYQQQQQCQQKQVCDQQQQQYQQYQQYQATNVPYAVVYSDTKPPRRGWIERSLAQFGQALVLAILSFVNLFFSIGLFAVAMIGVLLTVGFLPIACLGVVVLMLFVIFIRPIAAVDGWLYRQRQSLYDGLLRDD